MGMPGMSWKPKSTSKKVATFESATETPTFAGTNKPLVAPTTTPTAAPQTTGAYNKEKGGYNTPNSFYPTNEPNFKPLSTGQPNTSIEFTKDNNVIVNGITLSREQYSDLNKQSMGKGRSSDPLVKQAQITSQQRQEAVSNQQMAAEAAQVPQVTEADIAAAVPQETSLENVQAGGAALAGALSVGGTGAAIGSVLGPVGTVIGGAGGAIIGAIGGAWTKISLDKRGDVKQAKKVGTIAKTNFGQTIDALNAGIISKDEALSRWKNDKISLYSARENLKRETDKDLDRFLSGGADELADVSGYVDDLENIYENEFALALMQPNPTNIKYRQTMVNEE